jgi:membrane-bound inhibitor of C-type lysozyme
MRLIYNPSGTSHARDALRIENRAEQRRHFTAGEKMKILRAVDAMVATENLPFNMAATRLGVNPKSVKTWRKNAVALSDSSVENKLILHKGPSGIVSEVKVELIEFVEHWRLRGFPVTRMCLMRKVCKLKPEFLQKSCGARLMAISRFLVKNGLTHRVATHKAQRAPGEVRVEALSHLEVQVPRANDPSRHQDFVLNMDQTPVYHAMDQDVTIDFVGARTINMRSTANDGQRVTVAVTIAASGRRVPSMVVFKGEFIFIVPK